VGEGRQSREDEVAPYNHSLSSFWPCLEVTFHSCNLELKKKEGYGRELLGINRVLLVEHGLCPKIRKNFY